jgi:NAD(P)-dependent dehydrogenase (short-subunit alcohol dehydrogenase family)
VLPHMRSQGSGKIINLSSLAGVMAIPYFFAPYVASKHAIEGYTEALRAEVKPFGIKVAMVELGYMNTDIGLSVEQPAMPLEAYAPYRERAYDMEQYALAQGRDPEIVAQVIERIARDPNPPLRNAAGSEAELFLRIARPMPHSIAERIFDWLLMKPDRWQPEREPARRLLVDTQFADEIERRSLLALMILAPLLFLGWLWQRGNRA